MASYRGWWGVPTSAISRPRPPLCRAVPRPRIDVSGSSRETDALVGEMLGNALSVQEVFDEVLKRLQPAHIFTQTQCAVCAVSLQDVEEKSLLLRSWRAGLRSFPGH